MNKINGKTIFISMFFGVDVSFILNELESKKELRNYFKISEIFKLNTFNPHS